MKPITPIDCGLPYRRVEPSGRGNAPRHAARTADRQGDSVEISESALDLSMLEHGPTGRTDRIRRVRAAVRDDDYVTNKKIEWVVDRLLEELETWPCGLRP